MAGQLFTSSQLDQDGRQFILDDQILNVHYYTTAGESWDKAGAGNQSWFLENFLPNDSFDAASLASDRWDHFDNVSVGEATATQAGGSISLGVERDEGVSGLTSEGKWTLTGDFDIRLYIDWGSYYNEYRSITHTFLKVGVDDANAVRLALTFDGVSGYELRSEKVVGRDPKFFGWGTSGSFTELADFSDTSQYLYFRVTRESGVVRTYVSDGVTSTQVGTDISDSVFSGDVFVEFGVESVQYNTLRSAFTKFFVAEGSIAEATKFFSSTRGEAQAFPDRVIITVDTLSLSVIDEATSTLWMRLSFYEGGPVTESNIRVRACNGTIYCSTSTGVVAFDFKQDKIFKYSGSSILVADEPIALRNAGVVFRTHTANVGNIPDNNVHDVACRVIGGEEYLAFTNDSGVTVMRALASGVANSSDGPQPGSRAEISEKGALYWSGYDQPNNDGELSFFSNITALSDPGTNIFSRTGFYGVDTGQSIFGANITAFDIRTVEGSDFIGVGTTEGITFIPNNSPSRGYGVDAPAENPFVDPSFENYLGIDWQQFYTRVHSLFKLTRVDSFVTEGSFALELRFTEPGVTQEFEAGTTLGVYQDVDLTNVERIYYDIQMPDIDGISATSNIWNFEIVVGGTVVRSFRDIDGPFTKFNDSANVTNFEGVQRVYLQIRTLVDHGVLGTGTKYTIIDNIKVKVGEPGFRVLPLGNASIVEVLLQYDAEGHKIYFSTAEGYGAVDLDDNSLDYFISLTTNGPVGGETISSDFSRVTDEL